MVNSRSDYVASHIAERDELSSSATTLYLDVQTPIGHVHLITVACTLLAQAHPVEDFLKFLENLTNYTLK